jgi:3-hydroxyisobutyrate dehydrogenase-like beta-hydroxyacid dehydrogenase
MKLVSNLVLGLNRAALAEGLAFAEALGLAAAAALRVLRASAAYSRIMDAKGEKMVSGDFSPQARLSQHLKDVRLIRAAGAERGMDLPLSAAHEAILERAEALGLGDLDNSALIEALRRRSGTP